MTIHRVLFLSVFVCASSGICAQTDTVQMNDLETQKTSSDTVRTLSSEWGLTYQEWLRYQELMTLKKRGKWSPGLDPLTALGVSAESDSERKRFAELYVRSEFVRVRRELAFQMAVDNAWKRLYPDTPRLLDVARSTTHTLPPHRYAVVVSSDCATCEQVIQDRLQRLAESNSDQPIDVHLVDTGGDDAKLRHWVQQHRWLGEALIAHRATINHGDQFAALSQFPVVYAKKEGGQWTREL